LTHRIGCHQRTSIIHLVKSLLIPLSLLFLCAGAFADDTPPPAAPTGVAGTNGPGGTSGQIAPTPPPVANKQEDEDETPQAASSIARMAAHFRAKSGLADEISKLKAENAKLSADLAAAQKRADAAEAQSAKLLADWAEIEKGLLSPDDAGPAAASAAAIVERRATAKTAQELRNMSHPAANLPGAKAPAGADVPEPSPAARAAATRHSYWAQRKAPWATQNN
jgi:hypothetical protein